MKILMLTPYLPYPPSSGGQIRSYNLIKHLSTRHEITLFSLIKEDAERKYAKELKKYCRKLFVFKRSKSPWTFRNIIRTGFGTYPFLVIRNLVLEEKTAIEKELLKENYDLIHAETFYVMPHIPKTDVPILLVDQTIEYQVYRHYVREQAPLIVKSLFSIDVAKLKNWEKTYWEKAEKVVAVSAADKKQMLELSPGLDVGIVPNGVALDFFKMKTEWDLEKPKILFVANFKWLQNTEAALLLLNKIFPAISKQIETAKLWIVGQHIPDSIKNLTSKSVIVSDLKYDDEGTIKRAYYESSLFLSPLKGPGGTRLKHLAAMASGLPLITTRVGAEGLSAKAGFHLIIRDHPRGLASAAVSLLRSPVKARKIAVNARKLVEQKFTWKEMANKLDEMYKQTANAK